MSYLRKRLRPNEVQRRQSRLVDSEWNSQKPPLLTDSDSVFTAEAEVQEGGRGPSLMPNSEIAVARLSRAWL